MFAIALSKASNTPANRASNLAFAFATTSPHSRLYSSSIPSREKNPKPELETGCVE